jgi:RimJ/RimL family protein N-acetyltransferase
MHLRCEATPDNLHPDIEKIVLELDRRVFPTDGAVEPDDACYWWIVWDGDKPVAFAGLRPCQEKVNEGMAALTRCGVIRDYRGLGLQKKLIRARVRMAKRLGLRQVVAYVKKWNLASANSLIRCGFKLYGGIWGGKGSLHFYRDL